MAIYYLSTKSIKRARTSIEGDLNGYPSRVPKELEKAAREANKATNAIKKEVKT